MENVRCFKNCLLGTAHKQPLAIVKIPLENATDLNGGHDKTRKDNPYDDIGSVFRNLKRSSGTCLITACQ
jgi:hypothetical protein